MNKELLIRSLKKQVENIEKIEMDLDKIKSKVNLLVEELEDESKIGTPTEYDFGEKEYAELKRDVVKILKKDSSLIEEISEFISSLQKFLGPKITPEMKEYDKK